MHPGFSLPEIDMRPDYKTADEDVPIAMHEVKIPVPKHFENGWFSTASRTRQWVSNNLSMIPDKQSYRVRDAVSRRTIESIESQNLTELSTKNSTTTASFVKRRIRLKQNTHAQEDSGVNQNLQGSRIS